jgi:hypothetical protein
MGKVIMTCYYCGYPLTSDDYKLDKIVTSELASNIKAHWECIIKEKAILDEFDKLEEN